MRHWEWVLPVIMAVWFVINLLRKTEEERRRRDRANAKEEKPPQAKAGRPQSDIDRFLEEVNRRRREAAERRPTPQPEAIPVATVVPVTPAEARRPLNPRRPATARPTSKPAAAKPPTPQARRPVETAVLAEQPPRSAPAAWPATAPEAPPPAPATVQRPETANLGQLTTLLRSADSLRTAMMLRIILDPPLCRRRRV